METAGFARNNLQNPTQWSIVMVKMFANLVEMVNTFPVQHVGKIFQCLMNIVHVVIVSDVMIKIHLYQIFHNPPHHLDLEENTHP